MLGGCCVGRYPLPLRSLPNAIPNSLSERRYVMACARILGVDCIIKLKYSLMNIMMRGRMPSPLRNMSPNHPASVYYLRSPEQLRQGRQPFSPLMPREVSVSPHRVQLSVISNRPERYHQPQTTELAQKKENIRPDHRVSSFNVASAVQPQIKRVAAQTCSVIPYMSQLPSIALTGRRKESVPKECPQTSEPESVKLQRQIDQIDLRMRRLAEQKKRLETKLLAELQAERSNTHDLSSIHRETEQAVQANDPQSDDESDIFAGSVFEGKRNGFGTLYNKQGRIIYEGEWLNGQYEGRGRLYNHNQKPCFTNEEFIDNLHCMKISQANETWNVYEGDFKDGLFSGLGILHIQEGLKFHGSFRGGEAQGKGTLVNSESKRVYLVGEFEGGYIDSITISNK